MGGTWKVETLTRNDGSQPTLPFVLTITSDDGKEMAFRASAAWPPTDGNLFMRRYESRPDRDVLTHLETFPLLNLRAVHGRRVRDKMASTIELAIDRRSKKHCSILLTRTFVGDQVAKEAIFLRTETSTKSHRSRFYLQPKVAGDLPEVVIDTREKYPWPLKAVRVTRAPLRAGDYAFRVGERIDAVIERKTRQNMLAVLTNLESYHAHLSELATYRRAAVVIEAQYRDFLDPKKTRPVAAARCARALAAIAARHPTVQVVYAGNRKSAGLWAAQFFEGCSALDSRTHREPTPIQAALLDDGGRVNTGGIDAEIRHAIMVTLPDGQRISAITEAIPAADKARVAACLKALRAEGKLVTRGHGRGTTWHRERA